MTTSTIRLSNIVLATLLAGIGASAAAATTAATPVTVSGPHANEEFCKIIIRQSELFVEYMKGQALIPDTTKRAKFFADSKALNERFAKSAPVSLASDVARAVKNSNASIDAQVSGNAASIKATSAVNTSPEQLAVGKRTFDYCGVKM